MATGSVFQDFTGGETAFEKKFSMRGLVISTVMSRGNDVGKDL